MYRALSMVLVALVVSMLAAAQAADEKKEGTHEGTVVSAANDTLVMTGADNKQHSHKIGPTVKITVDGKPGKLSDLKAGTKIRVTTDSTGNVLAIATVEKKPAPK